MSAGTLTVVRCPVCNEGFRYPSTVADRVVILHHRPGRHTNRVKRAGE